MADTKGRARSGSFKTTPAGLRRRTDQMKRDLAAGKVEVKGGTAAPGGGSLAARLAAARAAEAAKAAPASKNPFVARAQTGQLPPKAVAAGAPGGMAAALRGSPANQKKKAVSMPKPKPTKASVAKRRVR